MPPRKVNSKLLFSVWGLIELIVFVALGLLSLAGGTIGYIRYSADDLVDSKLAHFFFFVLIVIGVGLCVLGYLLYRSKRKS